MFVQLLAKHFLHLLKSTWIEDTRASCHIAKNDDGMIDVKTID